MLEAVGPNALEANTATFFYDVICRQITAAILRYRFEQNNYCNFNLVVGRKILLDIMSD
jgi:hypothetical protein